MVGRSRELEVLWDWYMAAAGGRAGVAVVAGEPGIGKTRLLDKLTAWATEDGATVLRGGASEAEGMPPYLPFLEALGGYVRATSPDRLREQTASSAAVLAAILPELPARLGALPPTYPLPPEQARLRLFEAVADLLAAIAEEMPVVLLIDDLHWADAATLDLIAYLARRLAASRLLVAGAIRPGETERNPVLGRALAEVNRLRALLTVPLGRLTAVDLETLATAALGGPIDAHTIRILHTQSEGNPFFAEELIRGWLEAGILVQTAGRWSLTETVETAVAPTIFDAIRQRLAALPPESVAHLPTAAAIGRSFDLLLLAEVTGQVDEAVEAALLPAVRAGVLQSSGDLIYTFSHDKVRECLYREIAPTRRRRLHEAIGRALEAQGDDERDDRLAALAFHFARSGDRERSITYAERAARRAMAASAFADAVSHFRTALDLLGSDDPRRGDLLVGLGESAMLDDARQGAIDTLTTAETWYAARGDAIGAAVAAHRRGQALARDGAFPEARTAYEAALARLGDRVAPEVVRVLVDLGSLLADWLDEFDASVDCGRRALALAQRLGDPRLEVAATRTIGYQMMSLGRDLPTGIPLLERALALAVAADDPAEAAACCYPLFTAHYWTANTARAYEVGLAQIAYAQRCHDPSQARHIYHWLAAWWLNKGSVAETDEWLARGRTIADRLASPESNAYLDAGESRLRLWQGDVEAAETLVRGVIAFYRATNPAILAWTLGPLVYIAALQGKETEAAALRDELEERIAPFPPGHMALPGAVTFLALVAIDAGDRTRAARYVELLTPFAGLLAATLVDRVLGMLSTLLRDWDTANASIRAAEATARREGLLPELARTLEAQSDLVLARDGKAANERARSLLAEAESIWREIEWSRQADRVAGRLRDVGGGQASPPTAPAPAGLSEREVEVLRLVATGKSSRDVAEALSISEKTVAHHLTSIYAKTGSENRSGATIFAIRHGLVTT